MANEQIIAEGRTARQLVDALKSDEAVKAERSINYYKGLQDQELIKVLNNPLRGRASWIERGLFPRCRPLTKMIIDKSGLLFKNKPPVMEVFARGSKTPDQRASDIVAEALAKLEFSDFVSTLDVMTRLLKTTWVLVQYDQFEEQVTLETLTRANCEVIIDPASKKLLALVHRTSDEAVRVWTAETIYDISEVGKSLQVSEQPNTYGVIPAAQFYDTSNPLTGIWVEQDRSIVDLNELYNLHLTDAEFSVLWMKMSTLFTNMRPAGEITPQSDEVRKPDALGRNGSSTRGGVIGGPGQVVVMDDQGVQSPMLDYKAPTIDLKTIDDVVTNWVQCFASDWSVRVRAAGEASANSGFQLVVEEIDNLDLQAQRQRMFEAGFKRFYRVLARVLNVAEGAGLDEKAELFAKFSLPKLPVDASAQEDLWQKRIDGGRATVIDYFIEERGMSKEEAEAKHEEIKAFQEANMPKELQVDPLNPDAAPQDEVPDEADEESPN